MWSVLVTSSVSNPGFSEAKKTGLFVKTENRFSLSANPVFKIVEKFEKKKQNVKKSTKLYNFLKIVKEWKS